MKKLLATFVAVLMLFSIFGGALAQPAKSVAVPVNNANRVIGAEAEKAADPYYVGAKTHNPVSVKAGETLDQALNVSGGTIAFVSEGDYPWLVLEDSETGRVYAQSSNAGVASSSSVVSAAVTVGSNKAVKFDFKAWGEGSSTIWDKCIFAIDGTAQFTYGARDNDWEEYTVNIGSGDHTLTWTYSKDSSYNASGDYFAVDNVQIVEREALPEDPELDAALNAEGGNIHFHTTGTYPWAVVDDGTRVYAKNGNSGVHSSESILTATVNANAGDLVSFDFKAWGEGATTFWDHCDFYVDGVRVMYYGAYNNEEWENFYTQLTAGEHELKWSFTKDSTDNGAGDYFYVDEVRISAPVAVTSIEAPVMIEVPMYGSATIEYSVLPADATNKAVTFTVADDTVAKVDANGKVSGLALGQTTVTIASVAYPEVTATVVVKVYDAGIEPVAIYGNVLFDPLATEDDSGYYLNWITFYDVSPDTFDVIGPSVAAYGETYAYGNIYGYNKDTHEYFILPFADIGTTEGYTYPGYVFDGNMKTMSIDYSTGMMYGIGTDANSTQYLYGIDMDTGTAVAIGNAITASNFLTLAIDIDGNAYGIATDGYLYSIDLDTGSVTSIGSTGCSVNYIQDMCFDYDTGTLYWALCNATDGFLMKVDTATGAADYLGAIGGGEGFEIGGMFIIPANEPEPPANIPVTGVTITPAEAEIRVGETVTFTATVLPVNASNKDVEWDVDDEEVLAIDQNSTVLALAEGVATVYVTTDDGSFTAYATVNVLPPIGDFVAGYYFETDPAAEGWTFIDDDGDGYNWGWDTTTYTPYEGDGIIYSNSYVNYVGPLVPDNWAISPLVILPSDSADVTFYAQGQDSQGYDAEVFAVYVGTTDDITQMTKIGSDHVTSYGYTQYSVNLNDYAGQAVYFAIRHYNVTDMYILDVDQVEFWGSGTIEGAHNLTINYEDEDGNVLAPAFSAIYPEGYAYSVASPYVEGYIAGTAVVEGVMGTEDVTVTVVYTADPSELVQGFYFETDPEADGWTFVDNDGDGYNFFWSPNYGDDYSSIAYEGSGYLMSESFVNDFENDSGAAVYPDNWAISPAVELPTEIAYMTFYATSIGNYGYEHIAVYVGTTPDIEDMTMVMAETAVDYNTTGTANYGKYMVDLSGFLGETVYIAFNHFNCTDIFVLGIDQVEIFGYGEDVPAGLPGDVDLDGRITFSDISVLYMYMLGLTELSDEALANADFNGDGAINYVDISDLNMYLLSNG